MVRAPLWAVIGLVILATIIVIQGDAKVTTSGGCDDYVNERAIEDVVNGIAPPTGASFFGLGVGFCVLDYG